MTILTDIEHGTEVIASATSGIPDDWEFLLSGEGSQSPFHQWECAFWIQRAPGSSLYALRLDDFGDPQDRSDGEDSVPRVRIVAAWVDPPTGDVSSIARAMLSRYKEVGGKYVEFIHDVGEYEVTE